MSNAFIEKKPNSARNAGTSAADSCAATTPNVAPPISPARRPDTYTVAAAATAGSSRIAKRDDPIVFITSAAMRPTRGG